jgi:hypothetical protein
VSLVGIAFNTCFIFADKSRLETKMNLIGTLEKHPHQQHHVGHDKKKKWAKKWKLYGLSKL